MGLEQPSSYWQGGVSLISMDMGVQGLTNHLAAVRVAVQKAR